MRGKTDSPGLLQLHRPLSGGMYLALGITLLLIKYAIDWTLARLMLGRPWSPWAYFAPGAAVGMPDWGQNAAFFLTMLAVSLPFIATGLLLTLRRLRTTGLPEVTLILFFLPVVNFIYFILLALQPAPPDRLRDPEQSIPYARIHTAPIAGPPGQLPYGADNPRPGSKRLGRFLPAPPAPAPGPPSSSPSPSAFYWSSSASTSFTRTAGVSSSPSPSSSACWPPSSAASTTPSPSANPSPPAPSSSSPSPPALSASRSKA